jgi:2-polyprenyl-3-methyl-5-hydroxy-6-metoxy-1,4-benzoquinol methylase
VNWEEAQAAELESWKRNKDEKILREAVRWRRLFHELSLDLLPIYKMDVLDVGGGPSSILYHMNVKSRTVVDPLIDNYIKEYTLPEDCVYIGEKIEDVGDLVMGVYDLVLCTNALDHTDSPDKAIGRMRELLKPITGFLAIHCCIDNAVRNPHPAHRLNINVRQFRRWVDSDFETISWLTFAEHDLRYGWVKHDGRIGQPAMAYLGRKV